MSEANIPVGYCHKCKKDVPVSIQSFGKKNEDGSKVVEINVAYCPFCEVVFNLADDYKIDRYITKAELDEMMVAEGLVETPSPADEGTKGVRNDRVA